MKMTIRTVKMNVGGASFVFELNGNTVAWLGCGETLELDLPEGESECKTTLRGYGTAPWQKNRFTSTQDFTLFIRLTTIGTSFWPEALTIRPDLRPETLFVGPDVRELESLEG